MDFSILYSDIAIIIYELVLILVLIILLKKLYSDRARKRNDYDRQMELLSDRRLKEQIANSKKGDK